MKTIIGFFVGILMLSGALAWSEGENDQLLNTVDAKVLKRLKAETGGDPAQLYQKLGFSYFQQQEFDRSFLYFHAAVLKNPRLYWSWYYLGLLNLESGESYFKKAIEANNRFAPAYYWLARTYEKQGKKAEAIKCFNDYLKVASNDPEEAVRINEAKKMLLQLSGAA
jgi:tetratricopeptide (TPR) repeat protein